MSIVWHHISDIFFEDRECCLHILPQLSNEHIMLTHCSKMNVVSKVLLAYGPLNSPETARFCLLVMDFFFFVFDIMDVQNTQPHELEQKPMLATFRSVSHLRFSWFHNVFLKSFQDWLNSITTATPRKLYRRCWPEIVHIVANI